jgi:hypothetical protein
MAIPKSIITFVNPAFSIEKTGSILITTGSVVTISAISSGSITFTPALSNYTQIRSASLFWLDSTSLGPFYSVTGGGYFPVIDSTAFSVLFSLNSTTTIITQSNSSFYFDSASIVGSNRKFSISYLSESKYTYYDNVADEAYIQLSVDTTSNENSIVFQNGVFNSTTGEVEFTSNTPVKGGIGTSARGIGSFAMGSGSIAQESASIAEGINTLASGLASHAAGINTTASGQAAFSMGIETDADGMASFAAGSGSWARGTATVAMGIGTVASSSGQLVVGHYNETKTDINNIFVVGDGTSNSLRRNIIEVYGGQGTSFRGVKIDTAANPTITTVINGFNVYGQTYLRGNTDIITNKITSTGDTTLGTSGSIIFEAYNSLPALEGRTVMDWKGINFDDAFGTTSPGSTYLWRNSGVNHLYYSSSQLIQDGGNNTGAVAQPLIIGTANASNLELETNNTTRVFISSSGRVGIGTSSPINTLQVNGGVTATSFTGSLFGTSSFALTASYFSGQNFATFTQSVASTTWTFNHNLDFRTPVITVYDSNYEVVIPDSIQGTSTNQSVITFSTPKSGFASATIGSIAQNNSLALSLAYAIVL